jgi:hypothetical protein
VNEAFQIRKGTLSIRISHDRCIVLVTVLLALLGVFFGEKIPINGGLGWDGLLYGTWAKAGPAQFSDAAFDQDMIRRILPSMLVHYGLRIFGMPLNDANVIRGFGLLNILCLACVSWCWVKIAAMLGLGARGRWLGFCGFILNFAVIKHTSYYPVLTDIPAYAVGCGMLYFYLRRSEAAVSALTIVGAFIWPLLLLQGVVLLLFPRDTAKVGTDEAGAEPRRSIHGANFWIAAMLNYLILTAIAWSINHARLPISGYIDFAASVLPLSLAVVAIYVFLVALYLIDVDRFIHRVFDLFTRDWRRVVKVLVLIAVVQAIYWQAAPGQSGAKLYLLKLAVKSVYKPGAFLVGHAVYFGPIILMVILLWSDISRQIRQVGLGLSIVALLALLQALDGESRHLIHAFPVFVPFAVQAIERFNWSGRQCLAFALLAAFATKCWFLINSPDFETKNNLLEFPLQNYAMNYGVFMNTETYLIQGAVAVGAFIMLYRFNEKSRVALREDARKATRTDGLVP